VLLNEARIAAGVQALTRTHGRIDPGVGVGEQERARIAGICSRGGATP
jgi:hypothetical protein